MNIKTTFLLNRPGLFEVDVTYKPNTDPSTPDTAPWGGRGLHVPRCFPFKLAAAPLPGRTLLPAASQGTGTKTISSARSRDRAAASQTPALPWPGQAPRVWAGGVTAQRAHPGRRRGGAVKSAISVKGSESRGACRRKPAPGLLPRGGGDVSCHYASGSAAALLSQFCPNFGFFLIVMIGKSVPLTACEATACCCGFALPLGRVIGAACPGGQEKVPLDSRKEKHEHSHNMFVSGHLPPTVGLRESPSREEGGFTSASESNSAPARLPSGAGPRARRAPLEARATETGRAVHAAHPLPCGHVRVTNTAKYPTM